LSLGRRGLGLDNKPTPRGVERVDVTHVCVPGVQVFIGRASDK